MIRPLAFLALAGLAGCASPGAGGWARADGKTVDGGQLQAVTAQCRAEGAAMVDDQASGAGLGLVIASAQRSNKADTIFAGCMGRNGYITR